MDKRTIERLKALKYRREYTVTDIIEWLETKNIYIEINVDTTETYTMTVVQIKGGVKTIIKHKQEGKKYMPAIKKILKETIIWLVKENTLSLHK